MADTTTPSPSSSSSSSDYPPPHRTIDVCFAPRFPLEELGARGIPPGVTGGLKLYGYALLADDGAAGWYSYLSSRTSAPFWSALGARPLMIETGALNEHDPTGRHFLEELETLVGRLAELGELWRLSAFQLDEPLVKIGRQVELHQAEARAVGVKVARWVNRAAELVGRDRCVDLIEPIPAISRPLLEAYLETLLERTGSAVRRLVLDFDWQAVHDLAPRSGSAWRHVRATFPWLEDLDEGRRNHFAWYELELQELFVLAARHGLELQVLVGSPTSRFVQDDRGFLEWTRREQIPRFRSALGDGLSPAYMVQSFGLGEHRRPAGSPSYDTIAAIVELAGGGR